MRSPMEWSEVDVHGRRSNLRFFYQTNKGEGTRPHDPQPIPIKAWEREVEANLKSPKTATQRPTTPNIHQSNQHPNNHQTNIQSHPNTQQLPASKAYHPWPRQVKWKPINEKSSSRRCCHHLPTPAIDLPCFYRHCSLQTFEPREIEPRCESESENEIRFDWRVRHLGEQRVW